MTFYVILGYQTLQNCETFYSLRLLLCLVIQSYLTLCKPIDCSLPASSVHGILQTRILEWVAMLFSRGSSQSRDQTQDPALQADSLPSEASGRPIPLDRFCFFLPLSHLLKPNLSIIALFPC